MTICEISILFNIYFILGALVFCSNKKIALYSRMVYNRTPRYHSLYVFLAIVFWLFTPIIHLVLEKRVGDKFY